MTQTHKIFLSAWGQWRLRQPLTLTSNFRKQKEIKILPNKISQTNFECGSGRGMWPVHRRLRSVGLTCLADGDLVTQYQQWLVHNSALLTFHHLSLMTAQGSMWPLQVHNRSVLTHCSTGGHTGGRPLSGLPAVLPLLDSNSNWLYESVCPNLPSLDVTPLKTPFITWGFVRMSEPLVIGCQHPSS